MIHSMTGFGSGRGESGGEVAEVEIRSVNHKFIEVKVRLPRELSALETEIVRAVKDRLARGAVEVTVRRTAAPGVLAPRVDQALAAAYVAAFRELKERLGLTGEVTVAEVIAADGVVRLEEREVEVSAARTAVAAALAAALDALVAMRGREGEALARDLLDRLSSIDDRVGRVAELAPRAVELQRARLAERVAELARGVTLDPGRLEQEVALFADRTDVAEETTRLASHLGQARALVASDAPAGRKLDFLVQEMHREANTIGSKSQSAEISAAVVSLKAEIERIREQVQNVE